MKLKRWSWIGACSTGSSHIKVGTGCQDYASCFEVARPGGSALVAIVSDGAGSAQFASLGSRAVVHTFARQVSNFLSTDLESPVINEELARAWIDEVRDHLSFLAESLSARPRDFAATLVAVIALPTTMTVCHIGDGACVARRMSEAQWEVASWPAHGEYASTTYFVTDDPEPQLRLTSWEGEFADIAVFSDGLERLALNFSNQTAYVRFFDPMSAPLLGLPTGRARSLSRQLRSFLGSSTVTDRTDDDKSLIIARRGAQP